MERTSVTGSHRETFGGFYREGGPVLQRRDEGFRSGVRFQTRLRGPVLDQMRGLVLDQMRGLVLDQMRGLVLDQMRGLVLDQMRGSSLERPGPEDSRTASCPIGLLHLLLASSQQQEMLRSVLLIHCDLSQGSSPPPGSRRCGILSSALAVSEHLDDLLAIRNALIHLHRHRHY